MEFAQLALTLNSKRRVIALMSSLCLQITPYSWNIVSDWRLLRSLLTKSLSVFYPLLVLRLGSNSAPLIPSTTRINADDNVKRLCEGKVVASFFFLLEIYYPECALSHCEVIYCWRVSSLTFCHCTQVND